MAVLDGVPVPVVAVCASTSSSSTSRRWSSTTFPTGGGGGVFVFFFFLLSPLCLVVIFDAYRVGAFDWVDVFEEGELLSYCQ